MGNVSEKGPRVPKGRSGGMCPEENLKKTCLRGSARGRFGGVKDALGEGARKGNLEVWGGSSGGNVSVENPQADGVGTTSNLQWHAAGISYRSMASDKDAAALTLARCAQQESETFPVLAVLAPTRVHLPPTFRNEADVMLRGLGQVHCTGVLVADCCVLC
jgi:hypothetical protein